MIRIKVTASNGSVYLVEEAIRAGVLDALRDEILPNIEINEVSFGCLELVDKEYEMPEVYWPIPERSRFYEKIWQTIRSGSLFVREVEIYHDKGYIRLNGCSDL